MPGGISCDSRSCQLHIDLPPPLYFLRAFFVSLTPLPPQGSMIQPSCLSQKRPGLTLVSQPDLPFLWGTPPPPHFILKLQGQMSLNHDVSSSYTLSSSSSFPSVFILFFETGSWQEALAVLKFMAILPQSPECLDYRHEPLHLAEISH